MADKAEQNSDYPSKKALSKVGFKYRNQALEILGALRDLQNKYGERARQVNVAVIGDPETYARYSPTYDELQINADYFYNAKDVDDAYDETAENGKHPPRGDKSGWTAIIAHEYGHILLTKIAHEYNLGLDEYAEVVVRNAFGTTDSRAITDKAMTISKYAGNSTEHRKYREVVAEAFADVYCNGAEATENSRKVAEELLRKRSQ